MISINEATNWDIKASSSAKYRSIGCHIQHMDDINDFKSWSDNIKYHFEDPSEIEVLSIFEVIRPNDQLNHEENLFDHRFLYHGSKSRNFTSILSRGLLMPQYVVDEFGTTRSDVGMLGGGIYFSNSFNTSLKYTTPSQLKNTRLVAICEVSLGKTKDLYEFDTTLTKAPEGYNSTHGVKRSDTVQSQFKDDEYCIYSVNQQKLRCIAEVRLKSDGEPKALENKADKMDTDPTEIDKNSNENVQVSMDDIDKLDKGREVLDKVDYGLISKDGSKIPLQSVHVRAQLVDMVSKVVIFQEYENTNPHAIECKYVFPLDENSAVCGFEAFINDKHVIGICKDKETAHREYREAIEKGHGAYLMDQESAEVFKVNVGNLPPRTKCVVKITFVAELHVENEEIVFRLPGEIAPWQTLGLQKEQLQNKVISQYVDALKCQQTSLEISVTMPFDIRRINCSTHKVRRLI